MAARPVDVPPRFFLSIPLCATPYLASKRGPAPSCYRREPSFGTPAHRGGNATGHVKGSSPADRGEVGGGPVDSAPTDRRAHTTGRSSIHDWHNMSARFSIP